MILSRRLLTRLCRHGRHATPPILNASARVAVALPDQLDPSVNMKHVMWNL